MGDTYITKYLINTSTQSPLSMRKIKLYFLITVDNDLNGLTNTLNNIQTGVPNFDIIVIIKCTSLMKIQKISPLNFEGLEIIIIEKPDAGIYYGMNDSLSYYASLKKSRSIVHGFWSFVNTGDHIDFVVLTSLINENRASTLICGAIRYVRSDGSFSRALTPHFSDKKWARFLGAKPGHMSFYIRNDLPIRYFDTNYKIAADYKWMLEYLDEASDLKNKVCISESITSIMPIGGASTGSWRKFAIGQRESFQVRREIFGLTSAFVGMLKPLWGYLNRINFHGKTTFNKD